MSATLFLLLLSGYSVLTGLVVEAAKKLIGKETIKSLNLLTFIIALVIGLAGTFVYYVLNSIAIDVNNVIYAVLLSLGSGLCAMVGYDKVREAIQQFIDKKN